MVLFVYRRGRTNVEHAETVARSRNIFGPYEVHPYKHIITSYQTNNPLQKAGHASIVDDGKGNWYLAHLCGRKLMNGNCVLGRETSLQNIEFRDDDWCYLKDGGTQPYSYYEVEGKVNHYTFRKKETAVYSQQYEKYVSIVAYSARKARAYH